MICDFTLVLAAPTTLTAATEESLFAAGCDDATLSLRAGRIRLTFAREAPSMPEAIASATAAVKTASIGAEILRVEVGLDAETLAEIQAGQAAMARGEFVTFEEMLAGKQPPAFTPGARYCLAGRSIRATWTDTPSVAETVSPTLTIYRDFGTGEVTSCQIGDSVVPPLHGLADTSQHIEARPGHCGGLPTLRGTRITLARLLAELADGRSAAQIAADFRLDEAVVKGALEELAALFDKVP